jgi:glucose-6-phosphate isomerase, archaeal
MNFNPGFDIEPLSRPFGFRYGKNVFGPQPEIRKLDAIRKSLLNPKCDGPEEVYAIAMDVGKSVHKPVLHEKMLLFGVVTYAAGRLGSEPVRSQGHIHKTSEHSGWSPPEVYEIWTGKAIIYMQETAKDDPGRCFAVFAVPGDVVVVPPNWAHATISANPEVPLTFGAWCDREYGFEYDDVRAHNGLAWYPVLNEQNKIFWLHNKTYKNNQLVEKSPNQYDQLNITKNKPIYTQFEENPGNFQFVSKPYHIEWEGFVP